MILGTTGAPAATPPVSYLRTVGGPRLPPPLPPKPEPAAPRPERTLQVPAPVTVRPDRAQQVPVEPPKPLAEHRVGFPAREAPDPRKQKQLTDFSYQLTQPELDMRRRTEPDTPVSVSTQDTATPMTWKEYEKLGFDQKAAVDFNTLLIEAREKDLLYPEPITEEGLASYNADIESIFGKGGASAKVAPNVVALLKSIDFKALGQDLDEYLSLERAISTDELKDFSFSKEQVIALKEFDQQPATDMGTLVDEPHEEEIRGLMEQLAPGSRTGRAATPKTPEEKKAEGPSYLSARAPANLKAIDTMAIRNAFNVYKKRLEMGDPTSFSIETSLGNRVAPLAMAPPGYGVRQGDTKDAERDTAFETSYGWLMGNPNKDGLAAIMADFADRGWRPETQEMLWQYINDRTSRDIQYSGSKEAEAVREFLGWK
jgi:hypothetical protein